MNTPPPQKPRPKIDDVNKGLGNSPFFPPRISRWLTSWLWRKPAAPKLRSNSETTMQLSEQDKIWLAGYLDARGCLTHSSGQPRLVISNKDIDTLNYIHSLIGAGVVNIGSVSVLTDKSCPRLIIMGHTLIELLHQIRPYLRARDEWITA